MWLVDADAARVEGAQRYFATKPHIDVVHGSMTVLPRVIHVDAYVLGITSLGTLKYQDTMKRIPEALQKIEEKSKAVVKSLDIKSMLGRPCMPVGFAAFIKAFQGPPHAIVVPVQFTDTAVNENDRSDNIQEAYEAVFRLIHAYNASVQDSLTPPIRRIVSCVVTHDVKQIEAAWLRVAEESSSHHHRYHHRHRHHHHRHEESDTKTTRGGYFNDEYWLSKRLSCAQERVDAMLEFEPFFCSYLPPPRKTQERAMVLAKHALPPMPIPILPPTQPLLQQTSSNEQGGVDDDVQRQRRKRDRAKEKRALKKILSDWKSLRQ